MLCAFRRASRGNWLIPFTQHSAAGRVAREVMRWALVPFRSPLLRESLLLSFPPLTDMLKFSGFSLLNRGGTKYMKDMTLSLNFRKNTSTTPSVVCRSLQVPSESI